MALPGEINIGRVGRILQRLLQIKGPHPAPILTPEVIAAFILENDRPEWLMLGGTRLWAGRTSAAASVANFGHAGVKLLAASGVLSVVTGVIIENPTGVAAQYHVRTITSNPVADATATPATRDLRLSGAPSTQLFNRVQATQQGFINAIHQLPANQSIYLPLIYAMGPDTAVSIVTDIVNQAVAASFFGYERPIEQSEV